MAGFKNATKGYLPGLQVQSEDIGADVVVAADIAALGVGNAELSAGCVNNAKIAAAAAIVHTKLKSGAVSGFFTAKYIQKNAVTATQISAGTITNAKLSANTLLNTAFAANSVRGAAISAGTVTNADLSSPESFFQMHTRIAKIACNKAAASVAYMGRLPAAATLVKVTAAASTLNNIALASLAINFWLSNGTSHLLTGSGIQLSGTALVPRSGALSTLSIGQLANTPIYAAARTSTSFSALGVDIAALWKVNHTT